MKKVQPWHLAPSHPIAMGFSLFFLLFLFLPPWYANAPNVIPLIIHHWTTKVTEPHVWHPVLHLLRLLWRKFLLKLSEGNWNTGPCRISAFDCYFDAMKNYLVTISLLSQQYFLNEAYWHSKAIRNRPQASTYNYGLLTANKKDVQLFEGCVESRDRTRDKNIQMTWVKYVFIDKVLLIYQRRVSLMQWKRS